MAAGSGISDGSQPLSIEVTVCMNNGLVSQTPRSAHVGCTKTTWALIRRSAASGSANLIGTGDFGPQLTTCDLRLASFLQPPPELEFTLVGFFLSRNQGGVSSCNPCLDAWGFPVFSLPVNLCTDRPLAYNINRPAQLSETCVERFPSGFASRA